MFSKLIDLFNGSLRYFGGGMGDLPDLLAVHLVPTVVLLITYNIVSKITSTKDPAHIVCEGVKYGFVQNLIIVLFYTILILTDTGKGFFDNLLVYVANYTNLALSGFMYFLFQSYILFSLLHSLGLHIHGIEDTYKSQKFILSVFSVNAFLWLFSFEFPSVLVFLNCSWYLAISLLILLVLVYYIKKVKLRNIEFSLVGFLLSSFLYACTMLKGNHHSLFTSVVSIDAYSNVAYNLATLLLLVYYIKKLIRTYEYTAEKATSIASDREFIIKGFRHEIRTPLMALASFLKATELVYKRTKIDDGFVCPKNVLCKRMVKNDLPKMEKAIVLISNILDNLSSFGKYTSKTEVGVYELNSLTNICVGYTKFLDDAKEIPSTNIDVVPYIDDIYVKLSPSKYLQIVQNLISNSMRAIIRKGEEEDSYIKIVLGCNSDGTCFVRIEDTGIGMTPSEVKKCTDKYWSTKDNEGANGLGLYFVKKYVEDFGGDLDIQSKKLEGTVVTLKFEKVSNR